MITEVDKNKIIARLNERGLKKCPMCGNTFTLMGDGFFHNQVYKGIFANSPKLNAVIPAIGIVCNNCGFFSQHTLGSLGLLNEFKDKYGL